MYNSAILSCAEKFINFFGNVYKESIFNKWFLRFDDLLKKAAVNSKIAGIFIAKNGRKAIEGSKFYSLLAVTVRLSGRLGRNIASSIKGSRFVRTAESMIHQTYKNPFRVLGVFAASFLTANISASLILHRESKTLLALKLVLLLASMIAVRITADFGKMLKDSKVYGLFQWMIEVEK